MPDKKPRAILIFSLEKAELFHLMRPVAGEGGWQDFLRKMQAKILVDDGSVLIGMSDGDIGRAIRGMSGNGGFQGRLRKIFRAQFVNFLEEL